LARIAYTRPDGSPDIRPVNHLTFQKSIYLRSAFDAKFRAIADNAQVALEVDGEDEKTYWSVVVRGHAAQVTNEAELRQTGVRDLESWTATPKQFVLRITPTEVTGRRFAKTPAITPPVYAVPLTPKAQKTHRQQRDTRPSPIAHFPPHHIDPEQ